MPTYKQQQQQQIQPPPDNLIQSSGVMWASISLRSLTFLDSVQIDNGDWNFVVRLRENRCGSYRKINQLLWSVAQTNDKQTVDNNEQFITNKLNGKSITKKKITVFVCVCVCDCAQKHYYSSLHYMMPTNATKKNIKYIHDGEWIKTVLFWSYWSVNVVQHSYIFYWHFI